jgi:signal transduction histidine kinase
MSFFRLFRRNLSAYKFIFAVIPFEFEMEKKFQESQLRTSCIFLGVASGVVFCAFSFFLVSTLTNFLAVGDSGHSVASRIIATCVSFYFVWTAYLLLASEQTDEIRQNAAISFAYVLGLLIPLVDLFRPANKIGVDVVPMVITVLSMAAISRFTHRRAAKWLLFIFIAYIVEKFFFFGSLGPDAAEVAKSRNFSTHQLSFVSQIQIVQAYIFSYVIFRVIEARDRVLFLRERQLEKSSADRLRLLQGIGHDLRQPMTALMLHSDFAKQCARASDYPRMAESLRVIEANLVLMNSELTQVTELASTVDPAGNCVLKPISLVPILQSMIAAFQPRADASLIELRLELPKHTETLGVTTDELLLQRCLSNLISNAFKFTEARDEAVSEKFVSIRVELANDNYKILISDSGIGIAAEYLEKIWEPFFQINNPARKSEYGFGLGLANVRGAIDRMPDHVIAVDSEFGVGTTFTIQVPKAQQMLLDQSPLVEQGELALGDENLFRGLLFVLVEDDALLRASLSRALENWGARVASAESVATAKTLIDSLEIPPDFAIIDFRLPDGDARDVFKYIGESRAHTEGCVCHWVCLTGEHSTNLTKMAGLPISIIRKPVNLAMLRGQLLDIVKLRLKAEQTRT